MLSLTGFRHRFTQLGWVGLIAMLMIVLLSRLGFWQLARAEEKKQMLMAYESAHKQTPHVWQPLQPLPQQYQSIKVQGFFLPQVLLLDNQHYQHQWGYQVLSPLQLVNGEVILVNRGWVQGDISRQTFPLIHHPGGTVTVEGQVYYPSKKQWALGPVIEKKQLNLAVVELVDTKILSQFLQKTVYPFTIRLAAPTVLGFVCEWPVVAMLPERHYAYAVQWFVMSVSILIAWIIFHLRRKKQHELV